MLPEELLTRGGWHLRTCATDGAMRMAPPESVVL